MGDAADLHEREAGPGLLRPDEGEAAHRVSFVEVFFDVVFIFAFTRLSNLLAHDPSLPVLAETLVLTAGIWWIWIDTTWLANWLNPEKWPVRILLLALMGLGLTLASAIPDAFTDTGWVFGCAVVAIELVRTVFAIVAFRRHRPDSSLGYVRVLVWTVAGGALWLIGGFGDPENRLAWWTAALALEFLGPLLFYRVPGLGRTDARTWSIAGTHLAERVGLFFIIALGESIIVTGSVFAETELSVDAVAGFAAAFVCSVLLWMLYFNHAERTGKASIEAADEDERRESGLLARNAYTYLPIVMIAGVVLTAVADELVIVGGHPADWAVWLACGGPALYLAGTALFTRTIRQARPWAQATAIAVLAVLGFAGGVGTPVITSWVVNGVLLLVVLVDEWVHRRGLQRRIADRLA